jgi:hypothetical protein
MPINPFVFRNAGLDTLPISEGGMLPRFTVTGDRVGGGGFDSNIFTYGGYGGGVGGGGAGGGIDGLGGNVGGGFDPNYQARLDEEARLFFEKQKADEQARLAEEARLAREAELAEQARLDEEARLAEQARLDEEARIAALTGTPTTPPTELPPVVVNENRVPGSGGYIDQVNQNIYNLGLIGPANDPANLGANPNKYQDPATKPAVNAPAAPTVLPPVTVNEPKIDQGSPLIYSGPISAPSIGPVQYPSNASNTVTLPPVNVQGTKVTEPLKLVPNQYSGPQPFVGPVQNSGNPVILPKITATGDVDPFALIPNKYSVPQPFVGPVQFTGTNIQLPAAANPAPTNVTGPSIPSVPAVTTGGGTSTGGTGTGQNLTIKRDFGAELEETLAALQKNQSGIMGMYGDLYKQFMPKGITESESGIIDQYKTDLGRLQQRQAGVLSSEDVRQSQQAAREAYGARGQVMGPGAVGAEILGRENIRQQREDQARAGLQASYGNVLNMANLQTGNIFSPIGNLMSNTFNPLSPYAADVYGTNVNAQLAKEIAQKNYEAAIKSAELQGSAAKSASSTSFLGDLLKVGGSVKIAMACMPGDQAIDTPNGPVPIQDLRGGDYVIGYDNTVKRIEQLCSYVEKPETEFLKFSLSDGGSITVCGPHKILDIPAREWLVGSEMNGVPIVSITKVTGVTTSYDLMTDIGGYRIAGVPVNSMIPEMIAQTIEQVLLNRS